MTPITGGRLAAQPTIFRFKHGATPRALHAKREASPVPRSHVIVDIVNGNTGARVTIDIDVTEAPAATPVTDVLNGFSGG